MKETVSEDNMMNEAHSHQISQMNINKIVLEYLNKKGYHNAESVLRLESSNLLSEKEAQTNSESVRNYISDEHQMSYNRNRKDVRDKYYRNDKETFEQQERYMGINKHYNDTRRNDLQFNKEKNNRILRQEEMAKKYSNDPEAYTIAYFMLESWIDSSLDLYRPELLRFLYPIFVHCFLEMVSKNFSEEAGEFFEKFKHSHHIQHGSEIQRLSGISLPEHLAENDLANSFRNHKYNVHITKITLNLLLYFLHENEAMGGVLLIYLINKFINPIINSSKLTLGNSSNIDYSEDGIFTTTNKNNDFNDNLKQKLYLGKNLIDSDLQKEIEFDLKLKDDLLPPVNGKTLFEEFFDLTNPDDDTPPKNSIPMPLKDSNDIQKIVLEVEDSRSRINFEGPKASLPSVCMYTFHNSNNELICAEFNSDSTLIATGFHDSYIKIWSLNGKPLNSAFKNDPYNDNNNRKLIGHSGPVFNLSFSSDQNFLISCSEDKSVRLWSLSSYTTLVVYKGHDQPIWDVKFSPQGHYFATASHDQTARLWSTDHIYPLRIFSGHINDVDCVDFHPNSNYVFTGSADTTCRAWDVQTGNCVRVFIGHTDPVNTIAVSPDGKWLASSGEDSVINIWDIGSGKRLKTMVGHGRSSVHSLAFSKDGEILISGAADNSVRVWNVKKNIDTSDFKTKTFGFSKEGNTFLDNDFNQNFNKNDNTNSNEIIASSDHLNAFFTKNTSIFKVHFTRRNLCLVAGCYNGT